MLGRQFVRENPDAVREALALRGTTDVDVDEILAVDEQWRELKSRGDDLRQERNEISDSIGDLKREGKEEAAQEAIDRVQAEPRGRIRLTCPITLLHVHIADFLADFMNRYPAVTVDLGATNRRVDVMGEGVDVALRARPAPLEDSELAHRVLSDRGTWLVASPGLIQALGAPSGPEELDRFPSLCLGTPQQEPEWILFGPDQAETRIRHEPRYVTDDMIALRQAAVAGLGIVQLPALMVRRELRDGTLIKVLNDWEPRSDIIHAVFPSRRGRLPAVRTLIDELVAFYRSFEEE